MVEELIVEPMPPRFAVAVDVKVSDGAYGSIGGSCILSGLTVETTGAEIDELLDAAGIAWSLVRERVEKAVDGLLAERTAQRANGAKR